MTERLDEVLVLLHDCAAYGNKSASALAAKLFDFNADGPGGTALRDPSGCRPQATLAQWPKHRRNTD